ncbi:MAG: ABC transporter permease [Alphaproteobacteria bacterium]
MTVAADPRPPARVSIGRSLRSLLGRGAPVTALLFCGLLVIAAVAGDHIAPYQMEEPDFGASLAPPFWMEGGSLSHLLGTDQLGRDSLSRIIAGARISLITAAAAILVAGTAGVFLGLLAGYFGGLLETVLMRIVDAFLALPFILMALALVAALGSGVSNIVLVMILTNWARYARLVRSEVLSIKERDFVTLARIAGVSPMRIALRHVLPNAMNSVAVLAVLDFGRAIILESSLSFLGLGVQPPDVSWGSMLADGKSEMQFAWWLAVWPGLAILLSVLSFNAVGEWLKARFDPRSG